MLCASVHSVFRSHVQVTTPGLHASTRPQYGVGSLLTKPCALALHCSRLSPGNCSLFPVHHLRSAVMRPRPWRYGSLGLPKLRKFTSTVTAQAQEDDLARGSEETFATPVDGESTKELVPLRVATWNVNGLRTYIADSLPSAKFKGKTALAPDSNLQQLVDQTGANVLCFQETRCSLENMARFDIPGWRTWSSASGGAGARGPNRYSGTSIWVHHALLSSWGCPALLDRLPTLGEEEEHASDNEGRFVGLDFGHTVIVNTYTPNSGSNAEYRAGRWDPAVQAFLRELAQERPATLVVWCGDWNVAPTPRDVYFGDPASTRKGQRIAQRHQPDLDRGDPGAIARYEEEMEQWRTAYEGTDAMLGVGDKVSAGFLKVERDAFAEFLREGYVDCWRHLHPEEAYTGYTWYSARAYRLRPQRRGWRIDHILVNTSRAHCLEDCRVLPHIGEATREDPEVGKYGSDHVPLLAEIRHVDSDRADGE